MGISIINGLVDENTFSFGIAMILNLALLLIAFFFENYTPKKKVYKKPITFMISDLEVMNNKGRLIDEIKRSTKMNIFDVHVKKINVTRKEIVLNAFYREES